MKELKTKLQLLLIVPALLLLAAVAPVRARASSGDGDEVPANKLPDPAVYAELQDSADGQAYVIVILKSVVPEEATSKIRPEAVRQVQDRVLEKLDPWDFTPVYKYENFLAMTGRITAEGLTKLVADPEVIAVGPDAIGYGHLDVSVPFIHANDVHALGYTGEGITVAVLDTGIDSDHNDLSDDLASGWHFFLSKGMYTGSGAEDDHGHGTNVSGIITSRGVDSFVGVAPDTDILAIKVLGSDSNGWVTDWAKGVDYVVSHKNDYNNLCAINMSLGTSALYTNCPCDNDDSYTQLLQASLQAAKNAGIVTFASSGNSGSCNSMSSPACLSAATAVAAVYDQDLGREPDVGTYQDAYGTSFRDCFDATTAGDKITCFSNRNRCNELAAPGRYINAPRMNGGTSAYTGTSQASPHCAGVAALMCEKADVINVSLTPDQTVQIMKDTGVSTDDDCSTSPNPIRVDALEAVNAIDQVVKWRQPPDMTENGIDIRCDLIDQIPRVLADDFLCIKTGPITKIIFWGSWRDDNKGQITNIHLSIHNDNPQGPHGWSEPYDLIWEKDFGPAEFIESPYYDGEPEWCWDPAGGFQPIQWCDSTIWQYEISIDPNDAFIQKEGTVYWLDIKVSLDPFIHTEFGWKTSTKHWNDDAVWSNDDGMTWNELRYPPEHPNSLNSIDLSFEIITTTEDEPLTKRLKWSQPPIEIDPNSEIPHFCGWDEPSLREWIEPVWFDCWDCPTQRQGDADCDGYVGPLDMAILNAAFGTIYPNPMYNPCADFDRNLLVDLSDTAILQLNWDTNPDPNYEQRPQSWKIVADDFRCLGTMPVTSVHWWGSYLYWDIPEPPLMLPSSWRVGFWSNVPAPVWNPGEPVNDPENISPVAGGWGVLEVVNNGNMASVVDAVKSLESNTGARHTYPLFGPININDSSPQTNAQNFPGDGPYGVVTAAIKPAGTVDDIAFLARGNVWIPSAGNWTFYINSDDGEELSIDYGALTIGSESWNDNNFGTVNLTAGFHDIQVIHRENGGGANVEVAAAKGATNNLYFFRLIGSGDPGLPATSSIVPGFVYDPNLTQSKPGESGTLTNLAQAQTAITTSIINGTAAMILDDRVNHSDPNNPGLGNAVFANDHNNPWDVINGTNADEDDSAILVEGEIWIPVGGTYYIGYNSDDGAQLTIKTAGAFPWLSITEDVTGVAVITNTYLPGDTLQTDTATGKSWTVGQIFLPAGGYTFELLMFERGGGFFVEMFGGTIPGVYDVLLTGPERYISVSEVAPALMLEPGQPPVHGPRYSHPKELLWQFEVPAERVQQEFAGYDEFPDMFLEACFKYYVDLEPNEWFLQNPYTDIHIPEPIGHWKLNGDANDSAGNNHGTELGGPTYVPGVIRQAINLDGFDDYVLADDGGASMNGLDALTVALWVKSDVVGTDRGFIHFEDPCGHDNRGMRYDAMGFSGGGVNLIKVGVTSNAAGGPPAWPGRQQLESSSNVQTNDWQHLAMTWSSGKQLKLYINGLLDTPTFNEPALTGVLTGYKKVIIGRGGKYAPPAGGWDGLIDDVRIYDQALTKEQINSQMIGLVAHYKLDEPNGLIAADSSCNGNHGTLSDGPTWQPAGGYHGGALLFDGIDDYVDCGSVGISGNATRSLTGWAKASTTFIPAWTTVFGFSNAGSVNGTYFDIEVDNLGNYVLHTNGWATVFCPVDLDWHHFVAAYSGGAAAWYLDGALLGSAPVALSTIDEFRMGVRKMNGNYFPGLIDDVAIWNRILGFEMLILMNSGNALAIGDPNLYALWELDETSGYTASDSSGYGNHGTLNDPPLWRPMGQILGALDFDGKDDFVDNGKTASQLGIGGNAPRTVTAWAFTRSFMGGGIFEIGQDGSGADGRDFSLRAKWVDNNWRLQYWGATYDADFTYASKNKWVHFAHVHDGIKTRIYADGQEVLNVNRTLNTTDNKTFRLGRWQNNFFDGLIDDVRIYDRALPADEIKSLSGSGDDIFWLSVAAVYPENVTDISNPWGWKTRPESWMDDAVRFELFEEPNIGTVTDPCIVIPIEDPRTQESFDVAFELDTEPNYIKWEQPFTGIRNWPHYEDELSKAIVDPDQDMLWIDRMVADDWRCDWETPVTAAVWWGSYIGYQYQACQLDQAPAPVKPDYFLLTIWTDVPAGADPDPDVLFSHPDKKIWEYTAYDYDEVLVGYDKHPHSVGTESSTPEILGANTSTEVKVGPEFNINESIATAQYAGEPALPPASVYGAVTIAFPSASSTVVASLGFIDSNQIGAFWSVARGDSVTETFTTSEPSVHQAIFDFVVPTNTLNPGQFVNWNVFINGVLIGSFTVVDGQTGPVHLDFSFAPITGPNYTIRFEVTNEVLPGFGAHSLGYAEIYAGTVQLLGDMDAREPVFRYSVRLPRHAWFLQEDVNNIYWFSVVAVYKAGTDPLYDWGWTNHQHVFNDDAVASTYDAGIEKWSWEELYDQDQRSQDMSFMLFTEPECLKRTASDYNAWVTYGKPDCWCYYKQCRGDADWLLVFGRPVTLADLDILKAGFAKTVTELFSIPNGFCGDFDHTPIFGRPVTLSDLDILKLYFSNPDPNVPQCDQLPIYTGPYNFWTDP